jgi:hypothetical protein
MCFFFSASCHFRRGEGGFGERLYLDEAKHSIVRSNHVYLRAAYESSWPRSDNPGFADRVCFHLIATGGIEVVGSSLAETLGNNAQGAGVQIA